MRNSKAMLLVVLMLSSCSCFRARPNTSEISNSEESNSIKRIDIADYEVILIPMPRVSATLPIGADPYFMNYTEQPSPVIHCRTEVIWPFAINYEQGTMRVTLP